MVYIRIVMGTGDTGKHSMGVIYGVLGYDETDDFPSVGV